MKKLLLFFTFIFCLSTFSFSQNYGWTDISANIPTFPYDTVSSFTDVFFVNDNEGWITTNHTYNDTATILHTTDGGETFEIQTTQYSCNAIHMLNKNEGYAGGKNGRVYRTTDGGENWIAIGSISATLADISFPPTGEPGYCCGLNGNIHSIDSSGVTIMTSGVPDILSSISFPINSSYGKVCGGSIILTYANGIWGGGPNSYPSGGYNAIYMVDSLNGWVVGDGGIIAYTSDGQNWFEQTNPNPNQNTFFDLFFLNENNGWAIGSGGTIVHTNNGGVNWIVVGVGITSNSLTGVHFTSPTNGYVVGIGKTLIKYTEVSGIGDYLKSIAFEIYPNPAGSVVSLQSVVFSQQFAILNILDLKGRKLLEKQFPKGMETIELDVSNLNNGMYCIKLQVEDKTITKKLIIQK